MIIYMPTLALVNSIAFNQMKDPAAGTLGSLLYMIYERILARACQTWILFRILLQCTYEVLYMQYHVSVLSNEFQIGSGNNRMRQTACND